MILLSMNRQFLKNALGWGFLLWLVGYILGIIFFMIIPQEAIGFFILPIGAAFTIWVLIKKIKGDFNHYLRLAIVWTLMAIVLDYIFIVKMFKSDNYYKPDVYLYYFLTFALPLAVGWRKK